MNIGSFWIGLGYYLALIGCIVWWGWWMYADKVKECETLNGVYAKGICFAPGIVLKGESK